MRKQWLRGVAAVVLGTLLIALCQDVWAFFDSAGQVLRFPPTGPGTMYEGPGFRAPSSGVTPGVTATAVVGAVGAWGTADKICRLVVGPGKIGTVVRIAVALGMVAVETGMLDWLAGQGLRWNVGEGRWEKETLGGAPADYPTGWTPMHAPVNWHSPGAPGMGPMTIDLGGSCATNDCWGQWRAEQFSGDVTGAECVAWGYDQASGNVGTGWDPNKWLTGVHHTDPYVPGGGPQKRHACVIAISTETAAHVVSYASVVGVNYEPATDAEVEAAVDTATQTAPVPEAVVQTAVQAVTATEPAINAANEAWPNAGVCGLVYPEAYGETEGHTLQMAYNAAIPQAVKTELGEDTGADPGPYPTPKQPEDWEYTPEQMAAAQYTKDKQLDTEQAEDYQANKGDVSPGTEEDPEPPEKKSLTGVMNTFMGAVESLPIISAFTGWHLEIEADSVIHLPKGSWMGGGTIDLDFADYGWILEFMGTMLLGLTTWRWTLWLFEG